MVVKIGSKAPNLKISKWVQGLPTNIDKLKDSVVLVEVFQVNCPGCFLYGIPEATEIYKKYRDDSIKVIGLATAFEDYDKNTLENLALLLTTGEVIGETRNLLGQYGQLKENKFLSYKILFPVAMDSLLKEKGILAFLLKLEDNALEKVPSLFPYISRINISLFLRNIRSMLGRKK